MRWKESKLFIAISSSVATTLFLTTIFFTVIIPTWIQSDRNEIKRLTDLVPKYPQIVKDLKEKENTITELKGELNALKLERVFVDNNPYPLGYREIVIGDPLSKVKKVYPEELIKPVPIDSSSRDNEFIVVKIDHPLFSTILYGSIKKRGKINFILFTFRLDRVADHPVFYKTLIKMIKEAFPTSQYSESTAKGGALETLFSITNLKGLDIRVSQAGMALGIDK
jgi:hypothetical protein